MRKYLYLTFVIILVVFTIFRLISSYAYEPTLELVSKVSGIAYEEFSYPEPYDRGVYALSWAYHNSYNVVLIISAISSVLATIVLYKGRGVIEVLLLFNFLAIPRQRKTWGLVFDELTNRPVPLTVVRLDKKQDEGNFTTVSQGVADFEGRYKLYTPDPHISHKLTAQANNYRPFEKVLLPKAQDAFHGEVIEDIPLATEDKSGKWLRIFNAYRPKLYVYLLYYIFCFSLLSFLRSAYGCVIFPQATSYIEASLYGLALVWNVFVMFERGTIKSGRILDQESGKPLPNIAIDIYQTNAVLRHYVSDEQGLIKTDMPAGVYKFKLSTPGRRVVSDGRTGGDRLKINKEGLMVTDIVITGTDENAGGGLSNPFG